MSRTRAGAKALAVVAGVALSALVLTACASGERGDGGADDGGSASPATFTWSYDQEFEAYNANTVNGNSQANAVVLNQVLRAFSYYAPNGSIGRDTEYGTFEKVSDKPLTVRYTFADKAVWSDGEPVDCDDAVLTWLAGSGVTGEKGFSAASTAGYQDMTKPACKDGDKTFTVTYRTSFADWESMFGINPFILPAHILEKSSGVADVIALADNPRSKELAKAVTFYNDGWNLKPGELKPALMPSAGPYTISSWQAGESITLKANPKWWGAAPKTGTIVIRFLGGDQMAQALQNGEIDAMNPQPQVELVNQLKALGDKVVVSSGDRYDYEHLDFNFAGVFADRQVREAFAKCVPRQQIVDNLVKPQNPSARILQSRFIFPFQQEYAQFENGVGGQAYNTVDIAGAKQLLAAAGTRSVEVRLGWLKDPEQLNKRRQDTVSLIQSSCKQAGFTVLDKGSPTFFSEEGPSGAFDVALFAWTGSPLVSEDYGIYSTDGDVNLGGYSNAKVDSLLTQLNGELDRGTQLQLQKELDAQLWTDVATIPLFAHPGILATSPKAQGVEFNATLQDLTWNADEWSLR